MYEIRSPDENGTQLHTGVQQEPQVAGPTTSGPVQPRQMLLLVQQEPQQVGEPRQPPAGVQQEQQEPQAQATRRAPLGTQAGGSQCAAT